MIKSILAWWLSFGAADDLTVSLALGSSYSIKVTKMSRTSAGIPAKPASSVVIAANGSQVFQLTKYDSLVIDRVDAVTRLMQELPKKTSEGHE